MVKPEFYPRYYAAILSAADRAITFIEQGHIEEAKLLLEITISAAEEAYILTSGAETES